jgi:tryptophan halogenase
MSPNVLMAKHNKISDKDNIVPNYNFKDDTAYHFDATKFGIYLRDHYCKPKGVIHIQETVKDIKTNENGIECINGKHYADLFVDCTGFKSMLLNEVGGEFKSYSHILPNDSAWATKIPYEEKEYELEPYTNCTAIDNGWVWNIPSWERIGTGYVYSSQYISDEDALSQFKLYLNEKDLEFKNIKMRVGRQKEMWIKNVCTIGLSAGFIEPLESTGLLQTHTFLLRLVNNLQRGTFTQWDRDTHNLICNRIFDEYTHFVAMHYGLSVRNDTPYWQDVREKSLKELSSIKDTMLVRDNEYNLNPYSGYHYIATGLNWQPVSLQDVITGEYNTELQLLDEQTTDILETNKQEWLKKVAQMPSCYQYLKENIHE